MLNLEESDALAVASVRAIQTGDLEALRRLLDQNPGLARATLQRPACGPGTAFSYPLIVAATDWPGHFPGVGATVAALAAAGADVTARCAGPHRETALHFAASCDDVEALDALLDAGADIEADGAVIAGGTPLDDAVAFGQWRAARRLLEQGARAAVWHAAALGALDRVREYFERGQPRAKHPWRGAARAEDEVTIAFWCACHGGQRVSAEYLLDRGADLNWGSPWDHLTPLDAARRSGATEVADWLVSRGARSAQA
jgi:ankyrin repeat protein